MDISPFLTFLIIYPALENEILQLKKALIFLLSKFLSCFKTQFSHFKYSFLKKLQIFLRQVISKIESQNGEETKEEILEGFVNDLKVEINRLNIELSAAIIVIRLYSKLNYKIKINYDLRCQRFEFLEQEIKMKTLSLAKKSVICDRNLLTIEKKLADKVSFIDQLKEKINSINENYQMLSNNLRDELSKKQHEKLMKSVMSEVSMRSRVRNLETDLSNILKITNSHIDKKVENTNLIIPITTANGKTYVDDLKRSHSQNDTKMYTMEESTKELDQSLKGDDGKGSRSNSFSSLNTDSEFNSRSFSVSLIKNEKNGIPSIFTSILTSSSEIYNVVENCSEEELSKFFTVLVQNIFMTPTWLFSKKFKICKIINYRLRESIFLCQSLCYATISEYKGVKIVSAMPNKDSVSLYKQLFNKKRKNGFILEIPEGKKVFHPFENVQLKSLTVIKAFKSTTRPLLVKLLPANPTDKINKSFMIFKRGDDLRRDVAVMHIFRLLNSLWRNEDSFGLVEAMVYNVMSFDSSSGVIEFVKGTYPIQELRKYENKFDEAVKRRQINTAAGGTIASFLLGIKDRHDDNTLFSMNGNIFQIDFSYMLGQKVTVDTSDISITRDMKRFFGKEGWKEFVEACIRAFSCIRRNHKILIEYAVIVFNGIFPNERICRYLTQTLMLNVTEKVALKNLRQMLKKAPASYRTRFKNALHHTAQAFAKKEENAEVSTLESIDP